MKITEFPNQNPSQDEFLQQLHQMAEETDIPASLTPDAIEQMLNSKVNAKKKIFRRKLISYGSIAAVFALVFTTFVMSQRIIPGPDPHAKNMQSAEIMNEEATPDAMNSHFPGASSMMAQQPEVSFDFAEEEAAPMMAQPPNIENKATLAEASHMDNLDIKAEEENLDMDYADHLAEEENFDMDYADCIAEEENFDMDYADCMTEEPETEEMSETESESESETEQMTGALAENLRAKDAS